MDTSKHPEPKPADAAEVIGCGKPEPRIHWGNSKGIDAPSTTAESLMASEGYVQDGRTDHEEASASKPGNAPESMKHTDEGSRVAPNQRDWPL